MIITERYAYAIAAAVVCGIYFGFRLVCEIILALGWYVA